MGSEDELQPVLVEAWRGPYVESRYRGIACVMGSDGRVRHAWGDIDALVFPRSAIKPIQAIPFLEQGAAAAFGASDNDIALACASHSGEAVHRDQIKSFLARISAGPGQLECGIHEPLSPIIARDLIHDQRSPNVLHHNCSGQHAAMLALAIHLGVVPDGYTKRDHPVQKLVAKAITQLCDVDVAFKPEATDGCGIPTYALPLRSLAFGMARFGDPSGLPDSTQMACTKIFRAMSTQPYLVGGHDRFDTLAMEAGLGRFIVKTGAEGVYVASLPEAEMGVAIKIESGHKQASENAMLAILDFLGVLDPRGEEALQAFLTRPILSARGEAVGFLKPAEGFPV